MLSSVFRNPLGQANHPSFGLTTKPGATLNTRDDWKYDGEFVVAGGQTMPAETPLDQLDPFTPNNGAEVKGDMVMINGIMTDVALQTVDLQAMANKGYRVVGVHNATRGLAADLGQCLADKLNFHPFENRAITTAARVVAEAVEKNQHFTLSGHSQGALVVSSALSEVSNGLKAKGLDSQAIACAFSSVPVTTHGGAAATFPTGPRYTHQYNRHDLVPMLTGRPLMATIFPDPNERLVGFSETREPGELPAWSSGVSNRFARYVEETTHGIREIYLPHLGDEGVVA